MKKILVCGAGGFIGSHLVEKLKELGHFVIGVDLKYPEYSQTAANEFYIRDLRDPIAVAEMITSDLDEVYQLAADMGGAGYIFTGDHDADVMHNSATINLNVIEEIKRKGVKRVLYTSSACIYPAYNQEDPDNPLCSEASAYPAAPDSEYGWEKLFSERLYMSYARNYGIHVRIARLHNIFGPKGSWNNGKEKSPAAMCRKVAMSQDGTVDVWGPGNQTRSFLYIDECLDGLLRLMASDVEYPINIGSERKVTINELVHIIAKIANKTVSINNVPGPVGVMGRTSHNAVIEAALGWRPGEDLEYGLEQTYKWICYQIDENK